MNWRAFVLPAVALIMFAANSLLCRMALGSGSVDAASYSTIRVVSGAIMLLLIVRARQRGLDAISHGSWRSAFYLFLYAVPFSFAYNGLITGTGALILFGCVQLTMLIAAWRSGERPSVAQWGGLVIALGGLVYLMFPGLRAPPALPALMMAVAGIAWGVYTLRGRGAGDPLLRTTGNFTRAVPLVALVSVIAWRSQAMDLNGVLLAVTSGAVASGLGYVAWYGALKHLTATRASVLQLLVPVLAAVAGVLVLSEPFGTRLGIATLLVLGGVGLTLRPTARV